MNRSWYRIILGLCAFCLVIPLTFGQTSSQNVTLLGQFNNYSAIGYNDCWGYTAPDGREYAFLGVRNGTSIIDITNTPTLTEIAFFPTPNTTWKDIKTYRNYAYVVTDGSGVGLQIIDLSNLPVSATLVNTYTGFTISHNISIDTARAMLYAQGGSGIRAISLANPVSPVQVSMFGISSHDVYARNGIAYVSEGNNGTFSIFNVSNPSSPVLRKRVSIPNAGYVHNAWPTDDDNYLMTTEETSGKSVKLWDIRNIDSVRFTDDYLASPNIAHNTHIKGNYAYISYYVDGLRIVNISDPANIVEAGFYDTYPSPGGGYNGAWGAFPFFPSGKILISDMQTGLYVVYFDDPSSGVKGKGLPASFSVSPNYPNPFNPSTTITYELPKGGGVTLVVYDLLGRTVRTLVNGEQEAGSYTIQWDARNDFGAQVGSGPYFYRFTSGNFSQTQKMLLLR